MPPHERRTAGTSRTLALMEGIRRELAAKTRRSTPPEPNSTQRVIRAHLGMCSECPARMVPGDFSMSREWHRLIRLRGSRDICSEHPYQVRCFRRAIQPSWKILTIGPENLGRILFDRARRRLDRGSVTLPRGTLGSFVQISVALPGGLSGPLGVTAPIVSTAAFQDHGTSDKLRGPRIDHVSLLSHRSIGPTR